MWLLLTTYLLDWSLSLIINQIMDVNYDYEELYMAEHFDMYMDARREEKEMEKKKKDTLPGKIDEIGRLVYGLEQKLEKHEKTSKNLQKFIDDQNRQTSEELGTARMENESLRKHIEALELENSQLKKQLLVFKEKSEAPQVTGSVVGDTNSGNGNEETEVLLHGGFSALDIFPEEVWRVILDHVKEPKDLKSCYETCETFHFILEDQRQIFLFPDVLRSLVPYIPKNQRSSILHNYRSVCYGWKQSVDSYLQSEVLTFTPTPLHPERNDQSQSYRPLHFTLYNNPWNNQALQTLKPEINPIPSRCLIYNEARRTDRDRHPFNSYALREALTSFLDVFGSHIWAFKIQFHAEMSKGYHSSCYYFLRLAVSLMPNLKMLHISRPVLRDYDGLSSVDSDVYSDSDDDLHSNWKRVDYFERVVRAYRFPKLRRLKTVYFEKCTDALIYRVLAANPRVEKMELNDCFGGSERFSIFKRKLDLQELSFSRAHNHSVQETETWKVRKLTVDSIKTDLKLLFGNLEKSYGPTLEELSLILGDLPEAAGIRLNLSKVKVLNLEFGSRGGNKIDFILPMVSLEYLSLDMEYDFTRKKMEIQGIIWLEGEDLKKSNVWKLFPKLKKVRARRKTYHDQSAKWIYCTREEAVGSN